MCERESGGRLTGSFSSRLPSPLSLSSRTQRLGATLRENLRCGAYCEVWESLPLHGQCAAAEGGACELQSPSHHTPFELFPRSSSLCVEEVAYALYTSCEVPPGKEAVFSSLLHNNTLQLLPPPSPSCSSVSFCVVLC